MKWILLLFLLIGCLAQQDVSEDAKNEYITRSEIVKEDKVVGYIKGIHKIIYSNQTYSEVLDSYKNLETWSLKNVKSRGEKGNIISLSLTLGLSALQKLNTVTFNYEKCEREYCPKASVTIYKTEPVKIAIDCVEYELLTMEIEYETGGCSNIEEFQLK